jgi:nicotinamide-nucleotide amidase
VRVEIVAIGTELLLGQIADTNSQWLGEQLAANGIASHFHQHVGDNHERIIAAFKVAMSRSDAVIICGGLGPTQDDITRAALAELMGVALVEQPELVETIRAMFTGRGREMPLNNLLQAQVPVGATVIAQNRGTAPGLICPVGEHTFYAVPGVPYEMQEMFQRAILPDLLAKVQANGERAVIKSRVLRTWGAAESKLAEVLADRFVQLEGDSRITLAFLASGIEGIKIRITVRGADEADATALIAQEENHVRAILEPTCGDIVFGVDDETMEDAIATLLLSRGETLAIAESLTGGLMASRLVNVIGASAWFRGGIVSYASEVKFDVLNVPVGPVVSAVAAEAMAKNVRELLKSDVAISVTGVAGPDEQDGQPVGTVFVGIAVGESLSHVQLRVPGDRQRVRNYAAIGALNALRQHLQR